MELSGFKKYLTFHAAGKDLAIPADAVRGIVPAGELLQFPGLPLGVAGLTHHRGMTLVVIDLAVRLQLQSPQILRPRKLVIVQTPSGYQAGFLAERICDVLEYHARDFRAPYLHGQGRRRLLVAPDQLIRETDLNYLRRAG